jgi:demethylmenaquinone methyltransferase/2-methoxy-6-polyprenyl-1,4-benzoquinol methylase
VKGLARGYDALNTVLFLPAGGSRAVRRALVDALDVRPGQRVLELGCGTGQVTELLIAAGAEVVAVDLTPDMLVGARRRAPTATIITGNALEVDLGGPFDRVVLSFFLHNFEGEDRRRLLHRVGDALADGGRIGILEWALPPGERKADLWRRFVRRLEPSPGAMQIMDGDLESDVADAGLAVGARRPVAGGRAQILVLSPPGARG